MRTSAVQEALDAAGAHRPGRRAGRGRTHRGGRREALGVEVGEIANSLVFDADGEPLLVLTSGAHRVDTAQVAALLGIGELRRATAGVRPGATGQAIGGVAPLGHPKPLRTLVDVALARHDEVWAAGGIPHAVFPTTYEELLRITAGTPAEVGVTRRMLGHAARLAGAARRPWPRRCCGWGRPAPAAGDAGGAVREAARHRRRRQFGPRDADLTRWGRWSAGRPAPPASTPAGARLAGWPESWRSSWGRWRAAARWSGREPFAPGRRALRTAWWRR